MSIRAAVVFGGTKGIGKAIARNLLAAGFRVAVSSRMRDNVSTTTEELGQLADAVESGENFRAEKVTSILGVQCDVTSEPEVQACLRRVEEQWATPSVVVNAAGINHDGLLVKTSASTMHSIIHTNLMGAMFISKMAARAMIKKGEGSIINIGSVVGLCGNAGQVTYSCSKAGLVGLTKSLAKEVGSRGIRVNLIAPGFIETDMTSSLKSATSLKTTIPLQRFGTPDEVAEVVHFLTKATYITGQVFIVDGGLHLAI